MALACAATLLLSLGAHAAAHAGDITLFEDVDLRGRAVNLRETTDDLSRFGFNDKVSSISTPGPSSNTIALASVDPKGAARLIADATGCSVVAGPAEATAAGNVLIQALGDGELASHQDIRQVVRASFEPRVYEPVNRAAWDSISEPRSLRSVPATINFMKDSLSGRP